MNSKSVDLIYLDPPFNSNRTYSAPTDKDTGHSVTWTKRGMDSSCCTDLIERETMSIEEPEAVPSREGTRTVCVEVEMPGKGFVTPCENADHNNLSMVCFVPPSVSDKDVQKAWNHYRPALGVDQHIDWECLKRPLPET